MGMSICNLEVARTPDHPAHGIMQASSICDFSWCDLPARRALEDAPHLEAGVVEVLVAMVKWGTMMRVHGAVDSLL
jgi:hypothetical protein